MVATNTNRVLDTVQFMVQLRLPDNTGDEVKVQSVGKLLQTQQNNVPAAVAQAMSIGSSGNKEDRQFRRAMVLCYSVLLNAPPAEAHREAMRIAKAQLRTRLRQIADQAFLLYPLRVLQPIGNRLLDNPSQFLQENLIYTGGSRGSREADLSLSYNTDNARYDLTTMSNDMTIHDDMPGFFIGVDRYDSVRTNMANINATSVTRDLCITTQLTGCSYLYRINGPHLLAAHIQQGDRALTDLPDNMKQVIEGGDLVNLKSLAMAEYVSRSGILSGHGGHMGMLGAVGADGQDTYRAINRGGDLGVMNFNGYYQPKGATYVIAIRNGGAWQIFVQQHVNQMHSMSMRRIFPVEA